MDKNKVVLITGASRGIGRAIALHFASKGYDVAFTYYEHKELATQVRDHIVAMGRKCLVMQCDIALERDVLRVRDEFNEHFDHLDVLVNNAGIAIDSLFQEKTVENFTRTMEVNVLGTFLMSKYFGEMMFDARKGCIVNISSTNGINTYFPMCVDYDASKAGVNSLTHNLAMQFAPYVNVNAVAPGFIATQSEIGDMSEEFINSEVNKIIKRRIGTEQDVANLVYFLSTPEADFINSEIIRIDGGQYGA